MIGPWVRSKLRLRAATSSAREVSGSGAADTFTASAFSAVMTRAQLDPSAHAPWASTTLTSFIAILLLPGSSGVALLLVTSSETLDRLCPGPLTLLIHPNWRKERRM